MKRSILILAFCLPLNLAFAQITVLPTGEVGIGIDDPSDNFVVEGRGVFRGNLVRIGNGLTDNTSAKLEIGEGRSDYGHAIIDLVGDPSCQGCYSDFGIRLMRESNGTSRFTHRGTAQLIFNAPEASSILYKLGGYDKLELTGGSVRPGTDGTVNCGHASFRWANLYAVNGTIQTSDARLKKDINELPYGLSEIIQMRPVTYLWSDRQDPHRRIGLIAQEVDKLIPEVINGGTIDQNLGTVEEGQTMGMNYGELVPVLVKAIQEQQAMIEQKDSELAKLRAENSKMNDRMDAFENALELLSAQSTN